MECTACGTAVDDVAFCPNCGAELGGQQPGEPSPQQPDRPPSHQKPAGGQGRRGARGETSAGGPGRTQQHQASGGHDHRQPPQGQPAPAGQAPGAVDASGSALTRRQALAAGGGLAAIGAAGGWFFFLRDSSGPIAVVEESWALWDAGDLAGYRDLHLQGSPAYEDLADRSAENFGAEQETDWSIESREVIEQTDTRAVVRETYVIRPPEGEAWRSTWRVELRQRAGEWKIYEYRTQNTESVSG